LPQDFFFFVAQEFFYYYSKKKISSWSTKIFAGRKKNFVTKSRKNIWHQKSFLRVGVNKRMNRSERKIAPGLVRKNAQRPRDKSEMKSRSYVVSFRQCTW